MSFPKAKIHRFNEEITCAPPPGKYDPKLDSKVKGAVIDKSKRFVDQKIDSGSTESLDSFLTSKKGGTTSTLSSVFRTPQSKKVPHTPNQNRTHCPVQTSTPYLARFDTSISLDSADKDRSSNSRSEIQRLEEKLKSVVNQSNSQLLEKSKEISTLKEQIDSLRKTNEQLKDEIEDKKKILGEYNIKLEELSSEYDSLNVKILTEREDHKKYCEDLRAEIQGLKKCIEKSVIEKEDLEDVLAEKQVILVRINDRCLSLETELKSLQEEKGQLITSHANEIRELLIKHEVELRSVATAAELNVHILMTKLDVEVQKLTTELDNAQSEMHLEFEAKLKDVTNDTKNQLQRHKEFNQKCCDNVLNIGNMVSSKLNEFIALFKEYDEKYESVIYERNKVEHEKDELRVSNLEKTLTIIEIQELADDYKMKLEKSVAKCKKYEITVTRMQETIKALSDRLFTSESDVEHLNEVQNVLQLEKIQLCKGMAELEKDIINDVVSLKTQLLNKLETFKSEAAAEAEKLREAVDEKQRTIDMLLDEVDFYQSKLIEKDELICCFENNMQNQNLKLIDIKNQCQALEEEANKKNAQAETLREQLKQSGELIHELQSLRLYHDGQIEMLIQKLDETQAWALQGRDRVNILTSENEEKNEKIISLKNEIIANKECIQSMMNLATELRDKENHIESLKNQVNETKNVIQEKEKYIDEIISDLVLDKERCTALENDKCKLESKLLATKEELQALQSDNIEKARFIVEQSLKTDQLKDVQNEINEHRERLMEENRSLQLKLTETEEKLTTVEYDSDIKDTIIVQIQNALKDHARLVAKKEEEIKSLNNTIAGQEERLNDCDVLIAKMYHIQLVEMTNKYDAQSDENDKLKQKLSETNALLEKQQKVSEDFRRKLEMEEQDKKSKLNAAENDLMQKEQQLEAQRKQTEQLNTRLTELEETVRKLQEERSELIERRDAAQKELKDLDQQLALALGHKNLKQKIRHINQVIESNTEMKLQLEILSAENARLKKKSNKENVNTANQVMLVENKSPKSVKKVSKSVKLTNSPSSTTAVLKDRNQL